MKRGLRLQNNQLNLTLDNSESRQEVAYIATQDGKAAYILVIFADAPAYGDDWEIFPAISRFVFNQMVSR